MSEIEEIVKYFRKLRDELIDKEIDEIEIAERVRESYGFEVTFENRYSACRDDKGGNVVIVKLKRDDDEGYNICLHCLGVRSVIIPKSG